MEKLNEGGVGGGVVMKVNEEDVVTVCDVMQLQIVPGLPASPNAGGGGTGATPATWLTPPRCASA